MNRGRKPGPSATPPPEPPSAGTTRLDFSKIRHDLRTPIHQILGYCEMLQEDEDTPASFQPELQKIHAGGRQLLGLITEHFDEEMIAARQVDLRQWCHELRTPVNHIIGYSEMLQEEAETLGGKKLLPDLARIIEAARTWLALMEAYLIAPAAAATGTGRRSRPPPTPGPGFEPPATVKPASAAQLQGHLLVVDDDEANRDLLARRLRRQGLTVALAGNGMEALRLARSQPWDLILLDMMMPELDGTQVLSQLKSDPALAGVPVIMVSALDHGESVARCIELGAEDYIAKPFNPVFLRARIGACLEKKRLREQEATFLRQIQQEKQRTDELLHIILPHDVVEELKATGTVKPRRIEHVGVLFCDLVGFAAYSDNRSPEEIVAHLQTLAEVFEDIAARHRLEKIKTIGDAFMAVAGLLQPAANPALDCVRAGLDMIAAACQHGEGWQVRVGVHAGPVVAGVVGRKKYQYDVWGDTVNMAARVEQAGDPGSTCVTASTWRLIADHCVGTSKGWRTIKGKGELELFCLTGLR